MSIDPFGLLPENLKRQLVDSVLSGLAKLTERVPQASKTLASLKSDSALQISIDKGLRRATQRFVDEYMAVDEDLVIAISRDPYFWQLPSVRSALLEIVQNPTLYLEEEQTIIAQGFNEVLQERVNRQRVDKAVNFYLRCVAESLWHLEPFRPFYELHMQRMSIEAATAMVEQMRGIQAESQQAIITLLSAVVEQQKLLVDSSRAAAPKVPSISHNLPNRDYTKFIGREAELTKIIDILRPYPYSQHAFVSIDGIGGIGKSTLALEVGHYFLDRGTDLPEDERFQAVVWTSAKQTKLTAEGIQPRHQSHRTLEDIYTAIAVTLQREDITSAEARRQAELVRNALTRQRTLLIVDNLETIDDEAVVSFIREIPAPTKAIVTTRHRLDVTYAVRLTGMRPDDARTLIHQECAVRGVMLTDDQTERLLARTGGVPLAIVWTIGQMGFNYPPEAVLLHLGEPQSDIVRFCFEGSVSLIRGKPAEKLLIALSFFAGSASREGLGFVADLPLLDRDEGLADLEKLSIINKSGNRFSLLPVTKVMAADLATRNQETYLEYGKRWLSVLRTQHSSPSYIGDYRLHFGRYLSWDDGPSFLEAVDWAYEYGTASEAFSMTILASDYLDVLGRWNLLLELLHRAYELAQTVRNQRAMAYFGQSQGWLLEQKGEYDLAKRYFEESLYLYQQDDDKESEAVMRQRCAGIARKQNDIPGARRLLDEARTLATQLGDGNLHALIDSAEGKLQRDLQNYHRSWYFFSRARDHFERLTEEKPTDNQLVIGTYGQLAFVAYQLGRLNEAKELCLKGIDFFSEFGTKGYLATLKYRLALIEEGREEYDSARQHVIEALYWFEHLGMKPDMPAALELKARLESH